MAEKFVYSDLQQVCKDHGWFRHTYWWTISFPQILPEANRLASSVSEPIRGITNGQADYGVISIDFPEAVTSENLNITFYDTADLTVYNSLRAWHEKVISYSYIVQLIAEASKKIIIQHHNGYGDVIRTNGYYVIPEGAITMDSNSDKAGLGEITCSFKIVGVDHAGVHTDRSDAIKPKAISTTGVRQQTISDFSANRLGVGGLKFRS